MEKYSEKTLRKLQNLELSILKDFLEICNEYGLTYFGLGGTGIGALRHKGFIPWDDDIDIGMPRKDYEVLLKVLKEKYVEKYIIGNAENGYPFLATHIMLKGTKFVERPFKHMDCDFGIFLDLFPFDNASDNNVELKKQAYSAWFWGKILILRHTAYPAVPFKGSKGKVMQILCVLLHIALVLFRVSPSWIYGKCKKASCKYNDAETDRLAFFCDINPYENMLSRKKSFPLSKHMFEDIYLNFPKNLDEILTKAYGDYMKMPPVEKRKNHCPYRLKFKD